MQLKNACPVALAYQGFEIKPEIFKENPYQFKNKILNLNSNKITSCQQQPYET